MSEENNTDKNQTVFKEEAVSSEEKKDSNEPKTSTGLEENIASLLCYLVSFITGIVFLVIEKENNTVRFHAMQSVITFASLLIISIFISLIPFIGWIIGLLIAPVGFVLWLFLMFKAYQGGRYKLPMIGDFAEKQIEKLNP